MTIKLTFLIVTTENCVSALFLQNKNQGETAPCLHEGGEILIFQAVGSHTKKLLICGFSLYKNRNTFSFS